MRDIDYNGHVPGPDESAPRADESARSLDYQLGYQRGVMDTMARVLQVAHDNLAETLAKLERRPA